MGTNVQSNIAVAAVAAALLAGCAHGNFSGGRGWSSASGGSFISTPGYSYASASGKQATASAKTQEAAKTAPAAATLASNAD